MADENKDLGTQGREDTAKGNKASHEVVEIKSLPQVRQEGEAMARAKYSRS